MRTLLALPFISLALGCSSSSSPSFSTGTAGDASIWNYPDAGALGDFDPTPFGGSRPVKLYVPSKYSPSTPAPLLILLHGYSASGAAQELLFDFKPLAESNTVLFMYPDGTVDKLGKRFWNASDACCDFFGVPVDDVAYLTSLITEIETRYNVDPKRVYFAGHSNGGFMSYRMACDQAGKVAAIASLAGAMPDDPSKCKPSEPVNVLEMHGTADTEILWDGGTTSADRIWDGGSVEGGGPYPSVPTTVGDWVKIDGCSSTPNTSAPDPGIVAGMQTSVSDYASGCRNGTDVQLWTIDGAGHIPSITQNFGTQVFKFLLDHPKH